MDSTFPPDETVKEHKVVYKEIERFLYNDCGLKGLSGISNDVRELLASAAVSVSLMTVRPSRTALSDRSR